MGQIALNGQETTQICGPAQERLKDPIDETREAPLFDLAGAAVGDLFVHTSSGAEAVNQVIFSVFLEVARKTGKCHFVTTALEDAPTMQMLKRLEDLGCFVKVAPPNARGEVDLEKLSTMISPRTALVSVCMAQGLTGVIQPVEEIARIAKEKGALLHLDATHSLGKYPFSFAEIGADYLTFSADRIHGPAASGGLFAKKSAPLVPLILGGSGLRGGPEDTPSLQALCAAAQQASLFLDQMCLETARLRDLLEKEVARLVPGASPLFKSSLRLPHTTAISFPRAHQEALHYLLKRKNLLASIGGSYSQHLQRLLEASGVDSLAASCAISFSLTRMTTEEEVRRAAALIAESVALLRSISQGVFDV